TRHLIELGGLVQKAGLVALADDYRATLLGAFLDLANQLRVGSDDGTGPGDLIAPWRRRGLRAFDADKATAMNRTKKTVATGKGETGVANPRIDEDISFVDPVT
ncbi:MAG: conjugal transfer protein TraD, partial [Acetobacteraceae bacterium]|nr:conjugal transfer protein TraD [Acetobacteraceae bacterium]